MMALSRSRALDRMEGLAEQVEIHLGKIAAEPASQAVALWEGEIQTFVGEIERLLPNVGVKTGAEWSQKIAEWTQALCGK
jgi:hypothetical protein